jgi:alpha-1,2-mannosyltransferase
LQTASTGRPVIAVRLLRYAAWLPAVILATIQSYAALSRPSTDWLADLHVYRGAVAELRHHHSLYDFITSNGAPFTYPPFAGLVMSPLAYLSERPTGVVWTLVTVALVVVMALVVAPAAASDLVPERFRAWLAPALAAVLFASSPVSSNLRFGQVSIGLALMVLVDVLVLDRRRWQGVLIGLAAAIKLTPLIFLPMLWLGGRRRAAVLSTLTFVVAGAVAWIVLPGDSSRFWGTDVHQVNRLGDITTGGNQAFNGVMLRVGASDHLRSVSLLVVAVVVGGLALWRARRAYRNGSALTAVVIVGAASVVISPVSWTHHQVWLVLAAVLPVPGGRRWQVVASALTAAVMIIPLAAFVTAWPTPLAAIFSDSHLLLAVLIACVIPYRPTIGVSSGPAESAQAGAPGTPGAAPIDTVVAK